MTRYHTTQNGDVPYTPEEEAERDAEEAAAIRESVAARIDAERDRRFYANVEVEFPVGMRAVQMRDERDRANLSNVVQGAMILVGAGQGSTELPYITADNETQMVPAVDFLTIGVAVLQAKQAIIQAARSKKDALAELTLEQLNAYDATADWP